MGIPENISNKIYTSGQASLDYLLKNYKNKKFFHLGPSRDFDLFVSFKENKINEINESEYIICTGLFDEYGQDLKYYKVLNIHLKYICKYVLDNYLEDLTFLSERKEMHP